MRETYRNVDPKHCQKVDIEELNSEAANEGIITEPIDELYTDGNIQIAKSTWSVSTILNEISYLF